MHPACMARHLPIVLQWGRAPRSAETVVTLRARPASPASMGPRSEERGNTRDPAG